MYLEHNYFWQQFRQPQPAEVTVETLHEQGSGELNEDVLIVDGQLFGVFDGATSLERRRFAGGRTGGRLAADLAAKAFLEGGASHRKIFLPGAAAQSILFQNVMPLQSPARQRQTSTPFSFPGQSQPRNQRYSSQHRQQV